MALFFLVVPIIFTISSFTKSNCRDFIVNDEWPSVYPDSVHWIIRFVENAGVLSQGDGLWRGRGDSVPSPEFTMMRMVHFAFCLTQDYTVRKAYDNKVKRKNL